MNGEGAAAEIAEELPGAKPFRPPLLLRNPHVQSIVASSRLRLWRQGLHRPSPGGGVSECVLDCGGGVRLQGFFAPPSQPEPMPERGLVILLHGWEGCSDSNYLRSLANHLQHRGYATFRLNFRDHGATHHLNEGIFHSCRLAEVVGAVRAVADRYPIRPLHLVGFSLGGNFALRVGLRAPAAGVPLARVVAISPVIEPAETLRRLDFGPAVYRHYFIARWRQSLLRKQSQFPHRYDFSDWLKLKTVTEKTRYLVEKFELFPDLESYLRGYSIGGERLGGLTVPSTVVAAVDDPIIPIEDLRQVNPRACLDVRELPYGGHCGFLADYRLASWVDRIVPSLLTGDD